MTTLAVTLTSTDVLFSHYNPLLSSGLRYIAFAEYVAKTEGIVITANSANIVSTRNNSILFFGLIFFSFSPPKFFHTFLFDQTFLKFDDALTTIPLLMGRSSCPRTF